MMFATERVISNIYYNSKQGHVLLQKFSTTKTSFPILNNRKSSKPTHLYRNVLFLCFSWKPGEEYCKRSEVSFCCWLLLILNQEPHVFFFVVFFFQKHCVGTIQCNTFLDFTLLQRLLKSCMAQINFLHLHFNTIY